MWMSQGGWDTADHSKILSAMYTSQAAKVQPVYKTSCQDYLGGEKHYYNRERRNVLGY